MRDHRVSRRFVLHVMGAAPAAWMFAACSKKEESLSCTDVSGLSEAEKTARSALQYTDKGTNASQVCEGCMHYRPGAAAGQCGTCAIVKGPIHPKGYCTAWVAKT